MLGVGGHFTPALAAQTDANSMKTKEDVIAHASEATGVAVADVEKVLEAAFAFVKESAIEAGGFMHPAMGKLRRIERKAKDGSNQVIYRYRPDADTAGKAPGAGARRGGKGVGGGGKRKKAGGRKGAAAAGATE